MCLKPFGAATGKIKIFIKETGKHRHPAKKQKEKFQFIALFV